MTDWWWWTIPWWSHQLIVEQLLLQCNKSWQLLLQCNESWQLSLQCNESWSEELRKTPFFGGFLPVFCPVSCFFTDSLYITRIFWKKIGPSWLFLAAGTTDTKFRHSTGVATANSTNKDQKYKSVELGDQLTTYYKLVLGVIVQVCLKSWLPIPGFLSAPWPLWEPRGPDWCLD